MEYVIPTLICPFSVLASRTLTFNEIIVYLEQSLLNAGFEPDVFSTEEIEKEWKPDATRASISKIALPELLRDEKSGIMV